jgi:hypothetical protein
VLKLPWMAASSSGGGAAGVLGHGELRREQAGQHAPGDDAAGVRT